jgi:hypothetical protein
VCGSKEGVRRAVRVSCVREKGNARKIFVKKLEGNKSLRRSQHRYEDNIKRDPTGMTLGGTCNGLIWLEIRISVGRL